jgi:hypothetical protein
MDEESLPDDLEDLFSDSACDSLPHDHSEGSQSLPNCLSENVIEQLETMDADSMHVCHSEGEDSLPEDPDESDDHFELPVVFGESDAIDVIDKGQNLGIAVPPPCASTLSARIGQHPLRFHLSPWAHLIYESSTH